MVKALHEADIEVILDVVYNHTAEGNHLGPTLCFRGIDNANYYRLVDDDQAHYFDTTGTGNSLLMRSPARAAADHGLAALLGHRDARRRLPLRPGRHAGPPVPRGRPAVGVLRPGAAGPGRLPGQAHRRAVGRRRRRLPGGRVPPAVDRSGTASTATRCATSGAASRRRSASSPAGCPAPPTCTSTPGASPIASINFVTAHDGFTLADLVSYNEKHNEANGEGNNDGESHNRSWNCGAEGPTDDPAINALRAPPAAQLPHHAAALPGRADARARRRAGPHPAGQQQRLLPGQRDRPGSTGTSTRTTTDAARVHAARSSACAATTRCSADAGSSPASAEHGGESELGDIAWFTPDGEHMPDEAWNAEPRARRHGVPQRRRDRRARPARRSEIVDDSFLVLFNAAARRRRRSRSRRAGSATCGRASLDTDSQIEAGTVAAGTTLELREKSIIVFTRPSIARHRRRRASARSRRRRASGQAGEAASTRSRGRQAEAPDHEPAQRMSEPRPTPTRAADAGSPSRSRPTGSSSART